MTRWRVSLHVGTCSVLWSYSICTFCEVESDSSLSEEEAEHVKEVKWKAGGNPEAFMAACWLQ